MRDPDPPQRPRTPAHDPSRSSGLGRRSESDSVETIAVSSGSGLVDAAPVRLDDSGFTTRYELGDRLGTGGMGEVYLCRDTRIEREIAIKSIRGGTLERPDLERRFLYEARVQGQLEHPGIVPVYDLGVAPDGSIYFTMRRVRGQTLEQVLDLCRAANGPIPQKYSRRRLLTAFSSLCLAVDFVHSHGIIHRDIKPANVMLGDFGEVYLLDWGLAKALGPEDENAPRPVRPSEAPPASGVAPDRARIAASEIASAPHDQEASGPHTAYGQLMGTPGYMSPEQLLKPSSELDARSDVYALGCVLFEILTLDRLQRGTSMTDIIAATLYSEPDRPSLRAPERDVPPELDAVCAKATTIERERRHASARELHEEVERYLEGDRDVALRRELSELHANAADEALSGADPDEHARRRAMRELSRALALNPDNPRAMRTLVRVLMEPPHTLPAEVAHELDVFAQEQIRVGGRTGALAFTSLCFYFPLVLWMGLRHWSVVVFFLLALAAGIVSFVISRLARPSSVHATLVMALVMLAAAWSSSALGPFILVPGMATACALIFTVSTDRRVHVPIIALGVAAMLVPFALEMLGILPPSTSFGPGGMTLVPRAVDLTKTPTLVFLVVTGIVTIVTAGVAVIPFRREFDEAQRKIRLFAWHLRQMVPEQAIEHSITPPGS